MNHPSPWLWYLCRLNDRVEREVAAAGITTPVAWGTGIALVYRIVDRFSAAPVAVQGVAVTLGLAASLLGSLILLGAVGGVRGLNGEIPSGPLMDSAFACANPVLRIVLSAITLLNVITAALLRHIGLTSWPFWVSSAIWGLLWRVASRGVTALGLEAAVQKLNRRTPGRLAGVWVPLAFLSYVIWQCIAALIILTPSHRPYVITAFEVAALGLVVHWIILARQMLEAFRGLRELEFRAVKDNLSEAEIQELVMEYLAVNDSPDVAED